MSEKKQTSVDWLMERFFRQYLFLSTQDFKEAAEMRKRELRDAFHAGKDEEYACWTFEEYYEEKYEKGGQNGIR